MRLILLLSVLALGCFERAAVPGDPDTPAKKDEPAKKDSPDKKDAPEKKDSPEKKDGPAPKPPVRAFAPVDDLNADINVLQVLYSLRCTPAQVAAFAKAAPATMQETPPRKEVQVSDKYRRALVELRIALGKGDDDDVEKRFAALDEVRELEDPEFDTIVVTAAARKQAPELLRLFGSRQVANYIVGVSDFPDPVERITDAIDESRKLRGAPWRDLRDDVAFQAGWLLGGTDAKADDSIKQKTADLLDKAAKLEDKDFEAQRPALLKEAQDLLGKLGPTDVLRHFMERSLAETLSSHRLKACLERMEKAKK